VILALIGANAIEGETILNQQTLLAEAASPRVKMRRYQ
jgi:hypothetical protein